MTIAVKPCRIAQQEARAFGPWGVRLTRRTFLSSSAKLGLVAVAQGTAGSALAAPHWKLVAAPGRVPLVGGSVPQTEVWAYGDSVPGPEIRARQGDRLRVLVENKLPQETTVHWHGVRVPNAMDGVPHLTQKPIAPGERFLYEFDCNDAGTFWYHPHARSFEQVERGLAGALIVEEQEPLKVDRDVVWLLDDWRLSPDAQIINDFGNMMDVSHAGRLGNTVTINGRIPERFVVRTGERIRLRLINAANARIFGLEFSGHRPVVITLDGHPLEPHEAPGGRIILGPAQRADIVLDCSGRPGDTAAVLDRFYARKQYRLVDLVYEADAPLRESPPGDALQVPANPVSEPDLVKAVRHAVEFGGGMMDPKMTRDMRQGGRMGMMGGMMERCGKAWSGPSMAFPSRAESTPTIPFYR